MALFDACVDLNPHQIDAAAFALRNPLSKGVLLADEVGLGKTIEAGLVLCQYWAERKRRLIVICPASLRKQWSLELEEKFNIPNVILDARTSAESRYYTEQPTTDANTRSFLWYKASEGKARQWEVVGGCTFRLMVTMWRFQWVWFHPDERRKGRLQAAWPFFRSMFGFFVPDDPVSPGLVSFMEKNGYLAELAEFLAEREKKRPKNKSKKS